MQDLIPPIVAEFVGTFALVFVAGATIMNGYVAQTSAPLIDVALAYGLIVAALVSATMRVSGHLNPAITVGVAAAGRLSPSAAAVFVASQCAGAVLAALVLRATFPQGAAHAARLGGQWMAANVTAGRAIVLEAVATFLVVFAFFGTVVDARGPRVGGLAVGLAVTADVLAMGPLTGASMNPARSFGPALVSGNFQGHGVYWIGPLLGGIAAGLLYEWVFLRGRSAAPHADGAS